MWANTMRFQGNLEGDNDEENTGTACAKEQGLSQKASVSGKDI